MNQSENMTLQATLDKTEAERRRGRQPLSEWFAWPGRVALLAALVLAPWMIASVEPGAQKVLAILLSIGLALWWFETAVTTRKTQVLPYVCILVLLGIVIGFLQTVFLPSGLADFLVGRQAEIYRDFAATEQSAVRISLDKEATWNQLRTLVMALAALMLGGRYFRTPRDMAVLLATISLNGVAISFFGIIHRLTNNGKLFWTIELLNGGTPFGPFVNRNNASGFLLMCLACAVGLCTLVMGQRKNTGPVPMVSKEIPFWRQFNYHLLFFVAELTATKLASLIAVIVIGLGVLATLSRGGSLSLIIGAIAMLAIYGMARKPKYSGFILLPLVLLVFLLAGWLGISEDLYQRFEQTDVVDVATADLRFQNWRDTWPAVSQMGPLGAGLGAYSSVHRIYRTDEERGLFRYAENQFFQGLVEAGWPGLLLFCTAWVILFWYGSFLLYGGSSSTTIAAGTTASFLLFSQIPASFFDFGFYVPANMVLMAALTGFVAFQSQSLAGRLKAKSLLRFEVPNFVVQGLLLFAFATVCLSALHFHRLDGLKSAMTVPLLKATDKTLGMKQTDGMIMDLTRRVKQHPTSEALNYLGLLWTHRARLEYLNEAKDEPEFQRSLEIMDEDSRSKVEENLWALTSVPRMQEHAYYLSQDVSKFQATRFLRSPFIQNNLPVAASYYNYSRQSLPLQPLIHLRLGQLKGVLEPGRKSGDVEMERAMALAPTNGNFRKAAAIYYLQSGNAEQAATHLKKFLELRPQSLNEILSLVTGRADRKVVPMDATTIYQTVLPDDPEMLYQFAMNFVPDESPVRGSVLNKADQALGKPRPGNRDETLLKARISLALGEVEAATELLETALRSHPDDQSTRFSLATLLKKSGHLERALEEASHLQRLNPRDRKYNALVDEIEKELRDLERGRRR